MTEIVRFPKAPIAFEGWVIVVVALVVTGGLLAWARLAAQQGSLAQCLAYGLGGLGLLFSIFSLWFFRNPERTPLSSDPLDVISAADGTVLKVERVNDPRYGAPSEKISIFMSPLNVHVNRAPIQGVVEKVEYIPGKFFAANLDKASTDNERNLVIMRTKSGSRVGFLQIAGFIARRIVSHAKVGDMLYVGQRYGLIRFGSRMEIFLPAGTQVMVKPGDITVAGESVVARLAQ